MCLVTDSDRTMWLCCFRAQGPAQPSYAVKVDLLSTRLTGEAKFTGTETEARVSHMLGKYSTN